MAKKMDDFIEALKNIGDGHGKKAGDGHFEAMMLRKPLTELAQYLPAFNQAGTSIMEDQGVWPNATPGEIAAARGEDLGGPEQETPRKFTMESFLSYAEEVASKREAEREQTQEQEQTQGRSM